MGAPKRERKKYWWKILNCRFFLKKLNQHWLLKNREPYSKDKARSIALPVFKFYYKAIAIKTEYWHKNTHRAMEQNWKHRNKPTHIRLTNLLQRCQEQEWGKNSIFNKWCWKKGLLQSNKGTWKKPTAYVRRRTQKLDVISIEITKSREQEKKIWTN
jgi:hypothetical protein